MNGAHVSEGYARARLVTKAHAKSFYFASHALFGQRRRSAYALYSFCRRLDDVVDGDAPGSSGDLKERLALAREVVTRLYSGEDIAGLNVSALPWHPTEFAAFQDTVQRYSIQQQPFQELINGMEMDLTKSRYASDAELDLYCYRVASVVGLMMNPVLGAVDPRAQAFAADLGHAMQLTNILRDVREDLQRGRIYLPTEALASFGISEAQLHEGRVDENWRAFMKAQIARARGLYARSQAGVPMLHAFGAQKLVRLMGTLYSNILNVIEARDFDVFSSRAFVPGSRKFQLALGVLFTPTPAAPRLSAVNPEDEVMWVKS